MTRSPTFLIVLGLATASFSQPAERLVNIGGTVYGTQVRADTEYGPKYAGTNAVDGRFTPGEGCWYSRDWTQLPCALTFQFATEEDLRRVVLYQASWTGNMYHTKDFALETSPDGKVWTRAGKGQLADDNLAKAVVDVHVITRWLRVLVLTSYNPQQTCGFAEVEVLASGHPGFGVPAVRFNGRLAPAPSASVGGLCFLAGRAGPQVALLGSTGSLVAVVRRGEEVAVSVPAFAVKGALTLRAEATLTDGDSAEVEFGPQGDSLRRKSLNANERTISLEARGDVNATETSWLLRTRATDGEAAVRWCKLELVTPERRLRAPLATASTSFGSGPPPPFPNLRTPLQRLLIEWDWRLQDGIGTERNPSTYAASVALLMERGRRLIEDLSGDKPGKDLRDRIAQWAMLKRERDSLLARGATEEPAWEDLYLRLHWLRREIALDNPLVKVKPLVFIKQVPGAFSHQLTQYYGRYARPGGGVFVLDSPGVSMDCRQLAAAALPTGSFMHPEVSYGADRLLFAYCETSASPENTILGQQGRYYHLYEMKADGAGLRQLTDGPYNDFAPKYLPEDRILFISTRRGGWHRCGAPGCENYTLAVAKADGSMPRALSFHETQEWDPAVLNNGRIIYTRWDYVDRHPVFFEHLWSVNPDGTAPASYFGNNTFNPIGLWEPRPVPNSSRVMATAAAHHAMTAGSIVLVDVRAGVDGLPSITRLTPDASFPESEVPVPGSWYSPRPGAQVAETPESQRWPGHCYRSPYPLSEKYFLAAYSFIGLIGEPNGNAPNMFGLYLVDAFGNKELLYRDPNIASLWPVPLRPRSRPPAVPSQLDARLGNEGLVLLQDLYAGLPAIPRGSVKALRIVQVLPKSTPGIDNPPVGRPRGAPGKQVLGTVPVEADGSAYFRMPARIEVAFQALDEKGMAVQVMRSGTYVQPGERLACVGCHERRTTSPSPKRLQALSRPPAVISPGPEGSKPFSYPLLVQPILDRLCVSCHSGEKPAGAVKLTGESEGHYTASYNVLSARVPYSDLDNAEPTSRPGRFGAYGSPVMKMLLTGHHDVKLTNEDLGRLATWMDVSALFYGTFDPAGQSRQQRAERIDGPQLE